MTYTEVGCITPWASLFSHIEGIYFDYTDQGSIPGKSNRLTSSKISRQALKPTQPPIQWAWEVLSLGVKSPGHEAENSLTSIAQVKNEWSYTSNPPIGLHGMHTFTFTEYSGHVLPVILLHKVININVTRNNIMGYWELLTFFTWPTTLLFALIWARRHQVFISSLELLSNRENFSAMFLHSEAHFSVICRWPPLHSVHTEGCS